MTRGIAILVAGVMAAVAGCGREGNVVKDCDAAMPPRLAENGVGALRIGATVDEIRAHCEVLLDTAITSGNEGMPERRMTVVVGSVATTATISDGRVWRIEIATPRFRTADSLGVGSRMSDLRTTTARVTAGEHGAYVIRDDHCGLSFLMPGVVRAPRMSVDDIPDTATVRTVLIVGCPDTAAAKTPAP